MRIISFGDIEINYFFKNDLFIGYQLGGVAFNTLVNLNDYYSCCYYYNGNLENNNFPIEMIKINDQTNKKIFRINNEYTNICPYCNRQNKFIRKRINSVDIKDDDILIIDNLRTDTIDIIDKLSNQIHLIIKYVSLIEEFSLDDLYFLLNNRFKSIIITKNVYNYIKNKFKIDYDDLFQNTNPDILIIFNGSNGSIIETKDNIYEKENEFVITEVNNYGGLESFYASFIRQFLEIKDIDEKSISYAYIQGMINYSKTVMQIGAIPLINKIDNYYGCICDKFI